MLRDKKMHRSSVVGPSTLKLYAQIYTLTFTGNLMDLLRSDILRSFWPFNGPWSFFATTDLIWSLLGSTREDDEEDAVDSVIEVAVLSVPSVRVSDTRAFSDSSILEKIVSVFGSADPCGPFIFICVLSLCFCFVIDVQRIGPFYQVNLNCLLLRFNFVLPFSNLLRQGVCACFFFKHTQTPIDTAKQATILFPSLQMLQSNIYKNKIIINNY